MTADTPAEQAVAAERARLLAELDGQFGRPRGNDWDRGFRDGYLNAVREFREIVTNPAFKVAPLAELVQKMRNGATAQTQGEAWDDGFAAGRAVQLAGDIALAEQRGAIYCQTCAGDEPHRPSCPSMADDLADDYRMPFAGALREAGRA